MSEKDSCESCTEITTNMDYKNPYYCLQFEKELSEENVFQDRPIFCKESPKQEKVK